MSDDRESSDPSFAFWGRTWDTGKQVVSINSVSIIRNLDGVSVDASILMGTIFVIVAMVRGEEGKECGSVVA